MSGYIDYIMSVYGDFRLPQEMFIVQRKLAFDISGTWYFKDLGVDIAGGQAIIWTPNIDYAFEFANENAVQDIRKDFFGEREIEILKVKR